MTESRRIALPLSLDHSEVATLQDAFAEQERYIAKLEKRDRKLTDKLNRFRNVLPGRKRLYTLGRIAAMMEFDVDTLDADPYDPPVLDVEGARADALFLRRLEWDFEQAIDTVHPPAQSRHQWPRP